MLSGKISGLPYFANSAWIWSVDIATGEEIERYQCHYLDEGNIRLGTPYGNWTWR